MMNQQNDISALYPPPPPYIKFFTNENINKLPEYIKKKETSASNTNDADPDGKNAHIEKIKNELDFLIPPSMPTTGQYRAFGNVWQVKDELPNLEQMGIKQLYNAATKQPHDNENVGKEETMEGKIEEEKGEVSIYQYKIQELKKMMKSLLLNYLELVSVLSVNPSLYETKVDNIRTILVNIHHLLNEYRPHQSRESLIMLLEEQVEYKKQEIKKIEEVCDVVRKKLKSIQESLEA